MTRKSDGMVSYVGGHYKYEKNNGAGRICSHVFRNQPNIVVMLIMMNEAKCSI